MGTSRRVTLAMFGLTAALSTLFLLAASASAQPATILDHFKCYFTRQDQPIFESVRLVDQFDKAAGIVEDARVLVAVRFCNPVAKKRGKVLTPIVLEPFGLCNPVEKTRGTVVTPITNPTAHLVCYKITPTPFSPRTLAIDNQFGTQNLVVHRADLLCVPSEKRVL